MKKAINFQITRHICTTAILAVSLFSSAGYADSLMKSGQWKDPKTGLIWMRCSIGQKWNGSTCTGKALRLSFKDAGEYAHKFINEKQRFGGHSNWRVPNEWELTTIRYCSKGWHQKHRDKVVSELTESGRKTHTVREYLGPFTDKVYSATGIVTVPSSCNKGSQPTINTRIFPATIANYYWSSTPHLNDYRNDFAQLVNFASGASRYKSKNYHSYVRLVRGGQ